MSSRASTHIYCKNQLRTLGSKVQYELVETFDINNEFINKFYWVYYIPALDSIQNTIHVSCVAMEVDVRN